MNGWETPLSIRERRRDWWHEIIFKTLYVIIIGIFFGFVAAYCVKSVGDCVYKKVGCGK